VWLGGGWRSCRVAAPARRARFLRRWRRGRLRLGRRQCVFGTRAGHYRERQNCQNQPYMARRDEIDGHACFSLASRD
jgi:hypothetical protein